VHHEVEDLVAAEPACAQVLGVQVAQEERALVAVAEREVVADGQPLAAALRGHRLGHGPGEGRLVERLEQVTPESHGAPPARAA